MGETCEGKSVTFIPTASNPEKITFFVASVKKVFAKLGIRVDELDISIAAPDEMEHKLQTNDYIYVSGGNTFFLLQELKKSGADRVIIDQIDSGKLNIGESAGSIFNNSQAIVIRGEDIQLLSNKKWSLISSELSRYYPHYRR